MYTWLPASALLVVSLFATPALFMAPLDGEPVAVIFTPGMGEREAMTRTVSAGGKILSRGGFDNVVLARSGDAHFVEQAYRAGAVLVVSARGATGCASISAAASPASL